MTFRTIALTLLALAVAACGPPQPKVVARLSDQPILGGGTYTSGGGITVAADLREAGGMTMVCGVWAIGKQSALTSLAEIPVLDSGAVFIGRERIVSGLRFMRRVDPAPSYGGQEATCRITNRPWRGAAVAKQAELFFPRQVVADETQGFLGGFLVWFEPTGPGAGEG